MNKHVSLSRQAESRILLVAGCREYLKFRDFTGRQSETLGATKGEGLRVMDIPFLRE